MKRKNIKLEWYAFEYDWNSKSLIRTNVLGDRFVENIQKKIKRDKIDNYESLKEAVRGELIYYYWSKSEHEVMVTDLFPRNYEDFLEQAVKIDIWYQLEPNLDRIVEYVIRELDIKF